jgi:hypothetical protein
MGREPSVSGPNPSGSPRLTLTGTSLFESPSAPLLASPMEIEILCVCLLSTVHASTSGLATGWMPVVKPDVPRPPAAGRR